MNRPRLSKQLGAFCAVVVTLVCARVTQAQETTGRITGLVTDRGTKAPVGGITVIIQGPQGEDATLTDDLGLYTFATVPLGTYVVRFYAATSATHVERAGITVSAGATVRADAEISNDAAAPVQTYVIKKRPPAVDVGSARVGFSLSDEYSKDVPLERTFGDVLEKAPGAFVETSGNISIAGASGLENIYIVDGLNVTGMEYGDIMNRRRDASGGSNLVLDFVKELQVNTGGYRAEFGGAMGGVVNVVTKSGSNDFHGTVFSYWSPYWLARDPLRLTRNRVALSGIEKPDYDSNVGFEVGGPIIRNRLFFWLGFAPRREKSHWLRDVTPLLDANLNGSPDVDQATGLTLFGASVDRTRINQRRSTYQLGGKLDFVASPEHKLTLSLFTTPTSSTNLRVFPSSPGLEVANDLGWAVQKLEKTNTDLGVGWVANLFDKRWRIEANAGLHRESYDERSPFSSLNSLNQVEVHEGSLSNLAPRPGCEVRPAMPDPADPTRMIPAFDPCPVDVYHVGGYGLLKAFTGNRWMGELKSTHTFLQNELKYGVRSELNSFSQNRLYSGPAGRRGLVQAFPGSTDVWTFFSLPPGTYPSQFADGDDTNGKPEDLGAAPYYRDNLPADVKSINTAGFIQDTFHVLPNLVVDAGLRIENQKMYDFRGNQFLNLWNPGPRLGAVFDPSNDGRSKLFAHYGQFYETIPMNLAARYFGGEGILIRHYDPASCPAGNLTNGQWADCTKLNGSEIFNSGKPYPVQPHIKGQSHREVVAGFNHALTENLVVGVDYTHRWLANIIEDGVASDFNFVLANPGRVPDETLKSLAKNIEVKQAVVTDLHQKRDMGVPIDAADLQTRENELADLKSTEANLKGLASQPKPKRTYDAVTVSATKRFARNWLLRASYTYARLIGNYNGLYDPDNGYFAPNGSNAYDVPELSLNRNGPLANDRPHSGHLDGSYQLPIGRGALVAGISFSAYSGVPRNYMAQWIGGQQLMFLLPRGSAGRTPTVTQTDVKVAYRHEVSKTTAVEAFIDLFNILNRRTPLRLDDDYTLEMAAPIVNGTKDDLPFAKNVFGAPITRNPNFGRPIAYQLPFHARLGLRFLF